MNYRQCPVKAWVWETRRRRVSRFMCAGGLRIAPAHGAYNIWMQPWPQTTHWLYGRIHLVLADCSTHSMLLHCFTCLFSLCIHSVAINDSFEFHCALSLLTGWVRVPVLWLFVNCCSSKLPAEVKLVFQTWNFSITQWQWPCWPCVLSNQSDWCLFVCCTCSIFCLKCSWFYTLTFVFFAWEVTLIEHLIMQKNTPW